MTNKIEEHKEEPSYVGQQINKPVQVENLLTGEIASIQPIFPLTEAQFIHLRAQASMTGIWATNLLFAVVGYALNLVPKFAALLKGGSSQFTSAETSVLLYGIIASLVLYGIGRFFPNERTKIMKRISKHFAEKTGQARYVVGR